MILNRNLKHLAVKHIVRDFTVFLWLLKLGTLVNIYFLVQTFIPPLVLVEPRVLIPAQILFAVSAFRCLFPNRYTNNAVFHDSFFSSIFLTRFFATFSEVAYIYLFAYLIRSLNFNQVILVDIFSWLMVFQVTISQFFVWCAILTGRLKLYFYEELGWGFIFGANTIASAYLYLTIDNFGGRELLVQLNLLFGAFYLPWQLIHLRSLWLDANQNIGKKDLEVSITWSILLRGLHQSIHNRNRTTESKAWGEIIGITWMTGYWATLIPVWVYLIVQKI